MEALIAITLIMIILLPPIYMAFNLFYTSAILKDKTTATGIAYEGVEIMLNYRESWRNACDLSAVYCDKNSNGFTSMYNTLKSCNKNNPCKISSDSFLYKMSNFNTNTTVSDLQNYKGPTGNVSDQRFFRVIWLDDNVDQFYKMYTDLGENIKVDASVKFYSMVCIDKSDCKMYDNSVERKNINWSKTILLTSYIYR